MHHLNQLFFRNFRYLFNVFQNIYYLAFNKLIKLESLMPNLLHNNLLYTPKQTYVDN